jgi:hypothetical protein
MAYHKLQVTISAAGGGKSTHDHPKGLSKPASSGDNWFDRLSEDEQTEYIESHPNSKYAKNIHRVDHEDQSDKSKKKSGSDTKNPKAMRHVLADKIKVLPKKHKEFFETEQDQPNSEQRSGIAKHIRLNHKEIVKHMKGQIVEWKDGCGAIAKLATGKSISAHEKKALKALVIDASVIAASVAVTGGFAHGAALALKHVGFDVLKDVVLKTVIRGTTRAMGASTGVTGLVGLEALATTAASKKVNPDRINDKIMSMLVKQLAAYIEKGDIPKEAWDKAIDELAATNRKRK